MGNNNSKWKARAECYQEQLQENQRQAAENQRLAEARQDELRREAAANVERIRKETAEKEELLRNQNEARQQELRKQIEEKGKWYEARVKEERKEYEARVKEERNNLEDLRREAAEKEDRIRRETAESVERIRKEAAEKEELLRREIEANRARMHGMERFLVNIPFMIRDRAANDEGAKSVDSNVVGKIRPVPGIIDRAIETCSKMVCHYKVDSVEYKSHILSAIVLLMELATKLRSDTKGVILEVGLMQLNNVVDMDRSQEVKDALNVVLERNAELIKKGEEIRNVVTTSPESIDLEDLRECLDGLIQAVYSVPSLANSQWPTQFAQRLMLQTNNLLYGQNLGNAIAPDGEGIIAIEEQ